MSENGTGYVGVDKDYFVSVKEVLNITAETGALETQRRVRELPPADVEPVRHGHWINERYGNKDCLTCSVCGMTRNYLNQFEYCPHCGARMDGKEQEHENNNSL